MIQSQRQLSWNALLWSLSRCIHTPQVFTCCRFISANSSKMDRLLEKSSKNCARKCHDRATICLIKSYKPSPSRPNFAPERPATSCGLDFQGTIDGIHFERCKRWFCCLHHFASEKKVTLSQKKTLFCLFWHINSQDTLWDCQRLMEATWRLLCRVVSWRIFLGEHFMLFQDAVFWRYWKSRIWWKDH